MPQRSHVLVGNGLNQPEKAEQSLMSRAITIGSLTQNCRLMLQCCRAKASTMRLPRFLCTCCLHILQGTLYQRESRRRRVERPSLFYPPPTRQEASWPQGPQCSIHTGLCPPEALKELLKETVRRRLGLPRKATAAYVHREKAPSGIHGLVRGSVDPTM